MRLVRGRALSTNDQSDGRAGKEKGMKLTMGSHQHGRLGRVPFSPRNANSRRSRCIQSLGVFWARRVEEGAQSLS